MSFKQQGWIPYGKKAKSMNVGVKDNFGQTLESFEVLKDNKRDIIRLVKILKEKYDINLNPEKNWLDKDLEW
jgi:hypothetical protein